MTSIKTHTCRQWEELFPFNPTSGFRIVQKKVMLESVQAITPSCHPGGGRSKTMELGYTGPTILAILTQLCNTRDECVLLGLARACFCIIASAAVRVGDVAWMYDSKIIDCLVRLGHLDNQIFEQSSFNNPLQIFSDPLETPSELGHLRDFITQLDQSTARLRLKRDLIDLFCGIYENSTQIHALPLVPIQLEDSTQYSHACHMLKALCDTNLDWLTFDFFSLTG